MPGAFEIVMDERKALVDKIIGMMKQGYFFNKEEWDRASLRPQNPLSKVQYKGGNRLRLMAMVVEHGYTDPRWATARQYSEKGYFIKKGEHGVLCEKWIFEKQKKVKDQNGNVSFETVQLERPQVSFFRVFNAEQVQDFPSFSRRLHRTDPSTAQLQMRFICRSVASSRTRPVSQRHFCTNYRI